MPRSTRPSPDPSKSILLSSRRAFLLSLDTVPPNQLWLPDYGPSLEVAEVPLDDSDSIDPQTLRQCPPEAPATASQPEVATAASEIAKWTFDAYFALVSHRLKIYNRYRQLLNSGAHDLETLGKYRHACRLAIEQILRRDLPQIKGWSWNYEFPLLPIFEIELAFTFSNDTPANDEIIQRISLRAVVEVRQSNSAEPVPFSMSGDEYGTAYCESSTSPSSSSSSSESSGSP